MKPTFELHIYAADKIFYEGSCVSLILPTIEGQYGVLPHHRNLISAVVPGMLSYQPAEGEERLASVSSGLVKIEHDQVWVLVDSAERPEDIDAHRAELAAQEAKAALAQKHSAREYYDAKASLARALGRLEVKSRYENLK